MKDARVTCIGVFGDTVEVPTERLTFRPSVYGILIRDHTVLLCPQWDGWDYPGGGIEKGERINDALIREFKEETGLDVNVDALLYVSDNFFQPTYKTDEHWHAIKIYIMCRYVAGEISTKGFADYEREYMKEAQWIPYEEALTLRFYNSVNNVALLKNAFAQKAEGR